MPMPMPAESVNRLKSGQSIVAFFDGVESINYTEDVYSVLFVAHLSSKSEYKGFWDSNKDMTAVHTNEISLLGVRAQSLYDVLSATESTNSLAMQKEMWATYVEHAKGKPRYVADTFHNVTDQDASPYLDQDFRKLLVGKGFDHLIWITWSGLRFHIPTVIQPVGPAGGSVATYWIFDLTNNKLLHVCSVNFGQRLHVEGESVKDFLEKDNLAGLKRELAKMIHNVYKTPPWEKPNNSSARQLLGFE